MATQPALFSDFFTAGNSPSSTTIGITAAGTEAAFVEMQIPGGNPGWGNSSGKKRRGDEGK